MPVGQPTPLQEALKPWEYTRGFGGVNRLFSDALDFYGVDLWDLLHAELDNPPPDGVFNILDAGCGSGEALEQLLRSLPEKRDCSELQLSGIGLDVQPLPHLISPQVLRGDNALRSFPVMGDVTRMPIPSHTIDFGYSAATLQYVGDALHALEEGYRVLKPGRRMYWLLSSPFDVSLYPSFWSIVKNTPGAEDVFRWLEDPNEDDHSVVMCTKNVEAGFQGFSYDLISSFHRAIRFRAADGHKLNRVYAHRHGFVARLMAALHGRPKEETS